MLNIRNLLMILIYLIPSILCSQDKEAIGNTGVVWNISNSTLYWGYDPCLDWICQSGSIFNSEKDCENYTKYRICIDECLNLPGSDSEFLACRAECRLKYPHSNENKHPVGYMILTTFTKNEFDPTDRDHSWFIYDTKGTFGMNGFVPLSIPGIIQTPYVNLPHYCFRFQVILLMDDGTQCRISSPLIWHCYDI